MIIGKENLFFWVTNQEQNDSFSNINSKETFVSRNVKFEELVFSYGLSTIESQSRLEYKCIQLSNENSSNHVPPLVFDPNQLINPSSTTYKDIDDQDKADVDN